MPDVIDELIHDHREVEQMFAEYDATTDREQRRTVVDRVIVELVKHSEAEEVAVYPLMRKAIDDGEQVIEREITQHSEAEKVMKQLDGMDANDPQFDVLVHQLMADVREHIAEEEGEVFPQFRQAVSQDELNGLGDKVAGLKKVVPTRPHPMSPDHPPFNALLGPGVGLIDRVRDALSGRGKG